MIRKARRLGDILVESGAVTRSAVEEASSPEARCGPNRLGERLVAAGLVDSEAVARALADQASLPYHAPPLRPADEPASIDTDWLFERQAAVLDVQPRKIRLAIADPLDVPLLGEVRFQTGLRVEPVVVSRAALEDLRSAGENDEIDRLVAALPTLGDEDVVDSGGVAGAAPVVQIVDHILTRAMVEGASDIHFEPSNDGLRVRFRVDGVLRTRLSLPHSSRRPLLSRLKVLGEMDIAARRRPQDGGFTMAKPDGGTLRLRVSTLPLADDEKAVLRILDSTEAPQSLTELGFSDEALREVRRLGLAGQGVVLAAGPTGSGKTSSLFAALAELNQEGRNVVTLEDPVEYRIPGINQVQVHEKSGLSFPAGLRSILRQDPDVIMIGEIRDRETAEIAMAAAVTGHLVLSTIHTVDAPGAISRLLDMGVPPFLVAGGLTGVIAQRLVRKICRACGAREPDCPACEDGYSGRTGVFQVLIIDDAMRDEITRGASGARLRRLAREGGMRSLIEDARRKIAEGTTTPQEVARVVRSDPGSERPCSRCERGVPTGALACPHCGARQRATCSCGEPLQKSWAYCPGCLKPTRRA